MKTNRRAALGLLNRRSFLRWTTGAWVAPVLIPAEVLSAPGRPGALDRLVVGHIGIGGMGAVDLANMLTIAQQGRARVAAVCDVDDDRLEAALKRTGPHVAAYRDYRYILERKDIDAVVIATPDHWHAVQTVQACQTGEHVYLMDRHEDYNANHKEDWVQAIRTGQAPCMDIELAHRAATMCNLGNLSYLLGRPLNWDSVQERIIGDEAGNRLLTRPQRYPYVM